MTVKNRLETPRLLLREWRESDAEPWAAMNADPRVMEFFPSTYSRERSQEVFEWMRDALERDGYGSWALEIKDSLPFAGVIALQKVPFTAPFAPAMEVGWRLSVEAWGHGYATEGARAALEFAFSRLGLREVVAMTALPNLRSQRVMQRLGMTHDARDDFDHPRVQQGHWLQHHVLYRMSP